jgi:hypothetical protein
MAKAAKQKTAAKPRSKKDQYERFQEAARNLGIDDDKSAQAFEDAFRRVVPPRRGEKAGRK